MEPDKNDHESIQARSETSDELVLGPQEEMRRTEELAADLEMQDEIRASMRYALFDLKYPAQCARCNRWVDVGSRVVGRKLDGVWHIEEVACA